MRILEPIIRAVGQLSFRNKLRATAALFGIPLLIAAGALLLALNERVARLELENAAIAVQVPSVQLMGNLHLAHAAAEAAVEGGEGLEAPLANYRKSALAALPALAAALESPALKKQLKAETLVVKDHAALERKIGEADAQGLAELTAALRGDFDKINELSGLLVDGDAASSRLLDIMTTHLSGLVDTAGRSAQLGAVVLVKKSVRGSRRTDLTLQRGNFDALVLWSMDNLQKVSRDHPGLAAALGDAGSRLNATYLPIQEAMTTKMLDTSDFDMTPATFVALVGRSLEETVEIGGVLASSAETLLGDRLAALVYQRNAIVALIALGLVFVLASFVAAYISIMRGLNGLADAVNTMAAGDLNARVAISSADELGDVGRQFNEMASSLAQRTAELREKTNDIHTMLHEMQQGILTIVDGGVIHPEYSSFLEKIYETGEVAGQSATRLLFGDTDLGTDALDQVLVTLSACIGEDRMNFDFNGHLLPTEAKLLLGDGRAKYLEYSWSPIVDESDTVEKILVVVRDVTELRQLAAEAEHQKHELALIGQILRVSQEKFHDFIESARGFLDQNEALLTDALQADADLVAQLFRNMHTIKGNARTFGFLHLTNRVHEAEQAYDDLRRNPAAGFDKAALLVQLASVRAGIDEYEHLNDVTLGRKGPGRRGSAEKYVMVERADVEQRVSALEAIDFHAAHRDTLVAMLEQLRVDMHLIGTETINDILAGVFDSLPSLAKELDKAVPVVDVSDSGIRLKNQVSDMMRNIFMHLYRNSLDHGIEAPADRVSAGKPAHGCIRLSLSMTPDAVMLCLSDDGRGLALARIRAKAEEKGLIDAARPVSDDEVAQLVFASGFSTASAVTEVSGRGVGMDAVRGFVKREGGDIRLCFLDDSAGAEYRRFETVITLPAKFAVQVLPKAASSPVHGHDAPGQRSGKPRLLDKVLALPGTLITAK